MFIGCQVSESCSTSLSVLSSNLGFFQLLDIVFCMPRAWSELFSEAVVVAGSSFRRSLWIATILRIVWSIWLERNKRIFQGKEGLISNLLEVIKLWAAWWMVGSLKLRGVFMFPISVGIGHQWIQLCNSQILSLKFLGLLQV